MAGLSQKEGRAPIVKVGTMVMGLALSGGYLAGEVEAAEPIPVKVETVATGLERPTGLAFAPDGRLFVIEQRRGAVRVIKDGALQKEPWAEMPTPVWQGNPEGGLIGICVDPAFERNGYVYCFYTVDDSVQHVVRFTEKEGKGRDVKVIVSNLPTLGVNHNGGGIGFGPDGNLYVSVGENGRLPQEAQDLKSLRGKILRYQSDGTIPKDNPFPGSPVFCYGLRNTYRFAFDGATGQLYGAENGPNSNDEINLLKAGKNYGWPVVHGKTKRKEFEDPLITHSPCPSVTGIAVYRGKAFPALSGALVYGAFYFGGHGTVFRASVKDGDRTKEAEKWVEIPQVGVTDLAVDREGLVYLSVFGGYGDQARGGAVLRLAPALPLPPKKEPGD